MTDDNNAVMQAFAERVEDSANIRAPAALNTMVQMRPVGAQAIAVKRDPAAILRDLRTFAAAAGEAWYYSWDVKDKNSKRPDGKTTIEGPSVKLANDLARIYGNCSNGVERVEDVGSHWILHARFVDYETGYEYSRPFQQRKSQGQGQGMQADRQMDIAFQIGTSKAVRNCVVNALGTFSDFALAEAKASMVERVGKDLPRYRVRVVNRLEELGVDLARVERLTGKAHTDWDARQVSKLIAEIQAVNEGMTTPDEIWPAEAPADPNKPGKLEGFAKSDVTADLSGNATVQAAAAATTAAVDQARTSAVVQALDETTSAVKAAGETLAGKLAGQEVTKGAAILEEAAKPLPQVHGDTFKPAPKKPAKPAAEQVEADRVAAHIRDGETPAARDARLAQDERGATPAQMEAAARVATPRTAAGEPVAHDPATGEASDGLELPDFLKRERRGISDSPEDRRPPEDEAPRKIPDHLNMDVVRQWFPDKPPTWLSGYIARGQGVKESDNPHKDAPKIGNTWRAGWLTRDGDPDEMPME